MPAVSISQQQLMGMALCYKRGECDDVPEEVKKLAKTMTLKQLQDFAKTKHTGLPKHVNNESVIYKTKYIDSNKINSFINWLDSKEIMFIYKTNEQEIEIFDENNLLNSNNEYKIYIEKLGLKKMNENSITTLSNTVGMGAVNPPQAVKTGGGQPSSSYSGLGYGSGDRFDNGSDEEDENSEEENKKRKQLKKKFKKHNESKVLRFDEYFL